MERTPQKAPLPCFGLEHDKYDKQCRACPHADACIEHMASRVDKLPLDKLRFDILPEKFRVHSYAIHEMEDPELPYLQRLFCDCYASVFGKNPTENISRYKDLIAAGARKVPCSVRMFIMSNMVAHEVHEATVIEHTEKNRAARFTGKLLTGKLAVKRATEYQEMCQERFGTFSLKSLEVVTDTDKDSLEETMFNSESTVGNWIVAYKIHARAPRLETILALYADKELALAPEWLALEETYTEHVIRPYLDKKTGSETLQRHRFNVWQAHAQYKNRISIGRNAWLARQQILAKTVATVVSNFGYRPGDFLYPREPITDMFTFWMELGGVIRHNHCWRFLRGEPSYFTARREIVRPSS